MHTNRRRFHRNSGSFLHRSSFVSSKIMRCASAKSLFFFNDISFRFFEKMFRNIRCVFEEFRCVYNAVDRTQLSAFAFLKATKLCRRVNVYATTGIVGLTMASSIGRSDVDRPSPTIGRVRPYSSEKKTTINKSIKNKIKLYLRI